MLDPITLQLANLYLAYGLIVAGTFMVVVGAFGLLRLPDIYARIHASGMIDTGGAALILLGLCLFSGWNAVTFKLIAIGVFLVFTSPISGHAIALVAYDQNITPKGRDETRRKKKPKKKKPKKKKEA